MFNTKILYAGLLGLGFLGPAAFAAEGQAAPTAVEQQELSAVGKALAKLPFLTEAKPALNAEYYIYLHSASWCAPCKATMPRVVQAIKEMKEAGASVSIILVSYDRMASLAIEYSKAYGYAFPLVMYNSRGISELPGYRPAPGIPEVCFVKADGSVLYTGLGSSIVKWRDIVAGNAPESK